MNSLGRCVRTVGVLAFLAASFGCLGELLGISVPGTFTVIGNPNLPPNYEPTFTVQGGIGTADLTGNFLMPGCGFRLAPEFFQTDDQLTFRLNFVATTDNPVCPAVVRIADYEAGFQAVPVGRYDIRVIYDIERADGVLRFEAGNVTVR